MTQEEVSEMLKKPARIRCIQTTNGEMYYNGDRQRLAILQNHNALVVAMNENNKPFRYWVIASTNVAAVEMEIEEEQHG